MTEKKFDFQKILKKLPLGMIITWLVALGLAFGAFSFLRNFVASMEMLNLPGLAVVDSPEATPVADGAPQPEVVVEAPESNLPESWDGASRVTILFLGLDARDLEIDAPRSDTMILFTIDPLSKTAGMLSVPRDMWVDIPGGFGYGKINTAYALGEQYKLPGGGPGLAVQTVERFIGVPIQYYAQVDFRAFEEAIDAMGGLYMCVDTKIRVDPIGPKPKQAFEKGCAVRPGYMVLAYARERKHLENGDVDRAKHQQEVIMALRDQVLSPENFPNMVKIAPDVYQEASKGLRTNMSFEDALKLATLATQIDVSQIKRGVIDYKMSVIETSPDGLSIVKPIPDQIRVLRDDIFTASGALSPQAVGDPVALMQAEASRVNVLNGAYGIAEATELAARSQVYFSSQGMNVVGIGSADTSYDQTTVVLRNADLYTLRYILDLVQANSNHQVKFRFDPAAGSDVDIMLGNDWALNNPMP
ncbi:MAG: LCP family protein [Anaerolineae bacterium]|jgi:LCP family protein required for cell wall assembly|nr:LCP family protein [Anaerolineae bacterium]MBT3712832.1 LCP family protein [Anaerolineae bacterium]MBT4309648.1 LCP family protein [Anaerolineae bacterium]MBT4458307.1 LCP family protein [Anaerolineae bacterium]MBT4841684.1 LCP family protein [Anaerolineae bacterium]